MTRPGVRQTHRQRGAAIILVVVVIAALLAISAPFVVSMRLHERSARGFSGDVEARYLADAARNQAVATLMRTHPDEERRAREAQGDLQSDPEGHDTLDEVAGAEDVPPVGDILGGLRLMDVRDPRGGMAQVEVSDARGRIDINASGPDPVANLLGVTITTATIGYHEDEVLPVESTEEFFTDGDPTTVDGFLRVAHEYVGYRHIDRSRRPPAFEGLVRGMFFSRVPPPDDPDRERDYIPQGTLVQDGRGYKVVSDAIWRSVGTRRHGQLSRFENTAAIRRIADWEFGTLRSALVLQRYGVTLGQLQGWGIDEDTLFAAGLDPWDFDADRRREDETPQEREERKTAERALKRWGVPLALVRRFGGDDAVVRVFRYLNGLSSGQRDEIVERWTSRSEKRDDRLEELEGWLEAELEAQLESLTEMRQKADHLETIGRIELEEKVRPFVTVDAPPEGAAWSPPQIVNHQLRLNPNDWVTRIRLQDARRFQEGMVVAVRRLAGGAPEFRYCVGVQGRGSGRARILLFPQLDRDHEANTVTVSCRRPRPVNVNTASREVLRAVLTGLQSRVGQRARAGHAALVVTPRQAREVAEAIVAAPPTSHWELRNLLAELQASDAIDRHAVEAVLRNAIDPGDPLLTKSTVPFCYASGDVYELTATGIVNDPAGNEVARHRYREVVRVAPPRELVWHVDSQADFTDTIYVSGPGARGEQNLAGLHAMFRPGRRSHHVVTQPVWLGPLQPVVPWARPSRSHAPGTGDLRPLPGLEPDVGAGDRGGPGQRPSPGMLRQEKLQPQQLEGEDLAAFSLARGDVAARFYQTEDGATREALGPGLIRGWFRFDTLPAAGKAFLFDGGEGDGVNRLSLYLEGGELVLAAHDEALDAFDTGGAPRAAEVRYRPPRPFQAGNWYHVAAFFKGSDRGDLALAVDGRFVGRQTHGSRLAGDLDAFSGSVTVDDASGFPPQGFVRLGGHRGVRPQHTGDRGVNGSGDDANQTVEVLYYDSISGNTLNVAEPPVSELQQIQQSGGRIQQVIANGQPLASMPRNARRTRRGSGLPLRFVYLDAQGQRQVLVGGGFGLPHEAGTWVVPYGYTSRVKKEPQGGYVGSIRRGGATLAEPIAEVIPYTLIYDPVPGYDPRVDPTPQIVDDVATEIPVLWLAPYGDPPLGPQPSYPPPPPGQRPVQNVTGGFPQTGVLRIGTERVLYRGFDPVGRRFLNCVRGFAGTTAAPHDLFEGVVLESITVAYPGGYAGAPDEHYPQRPLISDGRVYVSLPGQGSQVEWISVQPALARSTGAQPQQVQGQTIPTGEAFDPRFDMIGAGLMLAPPIDTLLQGVPGHPLTYVLIREMLSQGGNLGQAPGQRPFVDPGDPAHPETNVLWKEVLKRFEVSGARGQKATVRPQGAPQPAGTPLVPTFVVRDRFESGAGDLVTVVDDQTPAAPDPKREERTIAHTADSRVQTNPVARFLRGNVGDAADGWLVAFEGDVRRLYLGAADARIVRWPAGNVDAVPDLVFGRARDPNPADPQDTVADAPGTLTGRIDDVVSMQLEDLPGNGRRQLRVHEGDGGAALDGHPGNEGFWQRGHLAVLDGEVVAVVGASQAGPNASDLRLLRGALATAQEPQSPESHAWRVPWPPVAVAAGGLGGPGNAAIPLRDGSGGAFRDGSHGGGYAAVDPGAGGATAGRGGDVPWSGVWPYADRRGNVLIRPVDTRARGAYAMAFGSGQAAVGADTLLVDLPFRFHDRHTDGVESFHAVYFQAARELPGAYVQRVTWDEQLPSPFCEVKVAVRLDGSPRWDAQPATSPAQAGALYRFDDPSAPNEVMVRADRVELRVSLSFKPGALYEDAWKLPAILGGIRVHYRQPTASIRREERVD